MNLPKFGDGLLNRFNGAMLPENRQALTAEFSAEYETAVANAKRKKQENEENKENADYTIQKLTVKEKIFLSLDAFWIRYLLAILFTPICNLFIRMGQRSTLDKDDIEDDDDDDDDDDYPTEKSEKLKAVIKAIKKAI